MDVRDLVAQALQVSITDFWSYTEYEDRVAVVLTEGHKYVLYLDDEGRPIPPEEIHHQQTAVKPADRDDFTSIPWVGDATANALYEAGLYTFEDLRNASDAQLLSIEGVSIRAFQEIREWTSY